MNLNTNVCDIPLSSNEVHQIENKRNECPLTVQTIIQHHEFLNALRKGVDVISHLKVSSTYIKETVDLMLEDFTRLYGIENKQVLEQLKTDRSFHNIRYYSESLCCHSYEDLCKRENKTLTQDEKNLFACKLAEINILIYLYRNIDHYKPISKILNTIHCIPKELILEKYYQNVILQMKPIVYSYYDQAITLPQIHSYVGLFAESEKSWDAFISYRANEQLFFQRGIVRLEQGNKEGAREDFNTVKDRLEEQVQLKAIIELHDPLLLANCYLLLGLTEKSLLIFNQIDNAELVFNERSGKYRSQTEVLGCKLSFYLEFFASSINALGAKIYFAKGDYHIALSHIQRALESNPGNQDYMILESEINRCIVRDVLSKKTYNRSPNANFIFV